jgi:hypothetical protein
MLIVMYFQDVCRRIVIYSAVGLGGIFLLFAVCGSLNLAYHLFAGHPAAVSPLAPLLASCRRHPAQYQLPRLRRNLRRLRRPVPGLTVPMRSSLRRS